MGISTTDTTSAPKSTTQTDKAPDPINSHTTFADLPDEPVVTISPRMLYASLWEHSRTYRTSLWLRLNQTRGGVRSNFEICGDIASFFIFWFGATSRYVTSKPCWVRPGPSFSHCLQCWFLRLS